MAIFKSSTGINSISDKSVRNYLAELNENLTYMFQNLTPDDNNAASVPKLTYVHDGDAAGRFEISANGITAQLTNADNIVATINLSSEGVAIQADKISIEGLVTANENFWIDDEGSMGAKNGTFSGTITSSTLKSATIVSSEIQSAKMTSSEITSSELKSTKITASEMSSTKITASEMSSTKITASEITSSTMKLGGGGTQGALDVYNSSGKYIGGWDGDGIYIGRGELYVGELVASDTETLFGCFKAYTDDTGSYLALQDETVGMGDHPNYAFWAGSAGASPPFRVTWGGKVYCKDMGSVWDGYSVGEAIAWIWENWPG